MSSSEDDLFFLENCYNKILRKGIDKIHVINKTRRINGEYHHLFQELKKHPDRFFNYVRMKKETFDYILSKVEYRLEKQWCNLHQQPILPEERLVITLRYLATGSSFRTMAFSFRMGATTVGNIVKETVTCIWQELSVEHMPTPTVDDFKNIAQDFFTLWNFPNVIGALDGKHVRIKCPKNSGSMYFNYKGHFSTILQGVADANYRFIFIEVGGYGKQSDGGTFHASTLYELIQSRKLLLPEPQNLPGTNVKIPFIFLADDAYPLLNFVMKPYEGTNLSLDKDLYNKRLSRARKTIECAFGIIYAKWRILSKSVETDVQLTEDIIKTICLLHNLIINLEGIQHNLHEVNVVPSNIHRSVGRPTNNSKTIRDTYCAYFANNTLQHNFS